jgi:hypothetical protein
MEGRYVLKISPFHRRRLGKLRSRGNRALPGFPYISCTDYPSRSVVSEDVELEQLGPIPRLCLMTAFNPRNLMQNSTSSRRAEAELWTNLSWMLLNY